MVEAGVALMWMAISAASAMGLSALARAAVTGEVEPEPMAWSGDGALVQGPYNFDGYLRASLDRP